jgi:hypothetical protein
MPIKTSWNNIPDATSHHRQVLISSPPSLRWTAVCGVLLSGGNSQFPWMRTVRATQLRSCGHDAPSAKYGNPIATRGKWGFRMSALTSVRARQRGNMMPLLSTDYCVDPGTQQHSADLLLISRRHSSNHGFGANGRKLDAFCEHIGRAHVLLHRGVPLHHGDAQGRGGVIAQPSCAPWMVAYPLYMLVHPFLNERRY